MNFSTLQELRRARGLTQAQLGALVGCSQSTVHRIEAGAYDPSGALRITLTNWMKSSSGPIDEAKGSDNEPAA